MSHMDTSDYCCDRCGNYIDTENIIRELRRLSEKHKNDHACTFETNWSMLCYDVANELEHQVNKYIKLYNDYNKVYFNIIEALGEERWNAAHNELVNAGNYNVNTMLMIAIEKLREEAGDFD